MQDSRTEAKPQDTPNRFRIGEADMDDEGPNWKPRVINAETVVQETTLPNGQKIIMHLHFGEYDMAHFERMCRLHPIGRLIDG